jgi:undecaprenyl-diphosphatase
VNTLSSAPSWSTNTFLDINTFARHTGWLHAPVLAYAQYGVVLFGLLLLAGWWNARRRNTAMTAAIWAPIATLIAVGINQPIVAAVHQARPYNTLHGILVLATPSTDPSFPSDHATMAGAVAAGMLLVSRRLGLLAIAAAGLMAFARVYIAAHYPADVLTGLALGAAVALIGYVLARAPLTAAVRVLRRTRLGPLLHSTGPAAAHQQPTPVGRS